MQAVHGHGQRFQESAREGRNVIRKLYDILFLHLAIFGPAAGKLNANKATRVGALADPVIPAILADAADRFGGNRNPVARTDGGHPAAGLLHNTGKFMPVRDRVLQGDRRIADNPCQLRSADTRIMHLNYDLCA